MVEMSERDVIDRFPDAPITRERMVNDLVALGVRKGMVLLVHTSLSTIGWVAGGPVAVIEALLEAVGNEGTIVMPSMSGDYSEPSRWQNPPVPPSWWQPIRDHTPPYRPDVTPTRAMGKVAETFRAWPGAVRSYHPTDSFVAVGLLAERLMEGHPLSYSFGEGSPLSKMCDEGGYSLLIGTLRNTILHLAEARAPFEKKVIPRGSPVLEHGERIWKEYEDYDDNSDLFPSILSDFLEQGRGITGKVGNAESYLLEQRGLVDFGIDWFMRRYNDSTSQR